jgi:hypothetical protein
MHYDTVGRFHVTTPCSVKLEVGFCRKGCPAGLDYYCVDPIRHGVHLLSEVDHMELILFIVLIALLLGAIPTWPYSRGWGYYPSGGIGLIVLILLILLLTGQHF